MIQNELNRIGIEPKSVHLGEVELGHATLTPVHREHFKKAIEALGFELIEGAESKLLQKVKTLVIQRIRSTIQSDKNWSSYLSLETQKSYSHLSRFFSSVEGVTLERYILMQKIEMAKELLIYDELTISEIAYKLDYSSVAHFSGQFKKFTGDTPSKFKKRKTKTRKPLDEV